MGRAVDKQVIGTSDYIDFVLPGIIAFTVVDHGVAGAMPLLFISNAFVPLHAMPVWMGLVARLNPMTYAIEAVRIVVIRGWTPDILSSLLVFALVAAACLALGTYQFRRQTGERTE